MNPFKTCSSGWFAAAALGIASIIWPLTISANDIGPLQMAAPEPDNLSAFVKDKASAIRLGKALFWDVQASSDASVACATCHNQAGADPRITNRVEPGPNGIFETVADMGMTLKRADFPVRSDDKVGSGGVINNAFVDIMPNNMMEMCDPMPPFHGIRQVTGRDAPTTINAIFNESQFWDGRAVSPFNGVDPSGNTAAQIVEVKDGVASMVSLTGDLELNNASLASQTVGPPRSGVEMICNGRPFQKLGAKLMMLDPLSMQMVAPDDSHLAPIARGDTPGLTMTYEEMIREAFEPRWWDSPAIITFDVNGSPVIGEDGVPADTNEFTVMEANFTLFWGVSMQLYLAELVSDDTPFDRGELSDSALRGLEVFEGDGRCDQCHDTPLFTEAVIDGGSRDFVNTGVRPIHEDAGRANGEFKTSGLRNIELTNPYFHNGGYLTLMDVVDFYDRGGDFPNDETDSQVRQLNLSNGEKRDLVQFMLELTDERVRCDQAPFDHPSLDLADGAPVPAVGAGGLEECLTPVLSDGDPNFHFMLSEEMGGGVEAPMVEEVAAVEPEMIEEVADPEPAEEMAEADDLEEPVIKKAKRSKKDKKKKKRKGRKGRKGGGKRNR